MVSVEPAPGGAFELSNGVDARVVEVEAGRVLELDWHVAGEDRSVVRFELTAAPASRATCACCASWAS